MIANAEGTIIWVAGASGVIGRALCPLLIEDGWSLIGMTRFVDKRARLRNMGVEPVVVDVFDRASLIDAVCEARPAIMINLLSDLPFALDPNKMPAARLRNARIREAGTRNLVAAAAAAQSTRMIAASIAFAYAPGPKPLTEESPLDVNAVDRGPTARAVARLEHQILHAPFRGLILRYGKLYGPGTGFETPAIDGPLHVAAAAEAARLAVTRGGPGIYNIAEDDGTVSCVRAARTLGWHP